MKNRKTFSKYVYNLHEHINTMLNKNQIYHMMMLEKDMSIFVQDVLKNKLQKKYSIIKM